jgi:hypothetical protein
VIEDWNPLVPQPKSSLQSSGAPGGPGQSAAGYALSCVSWFVPVKPIGSHVAMSTVPSQMAV